MPPKKKPTKKQQDPQPSKANEELEEQKLFIVNKSGKQTKRLVEDQKVSLEDNDHLSNSNIISKERLRLIKNNAIDGQHKKAVEDQTLPVKQASTDEPKPTRSRSARAANRNGNSNQTAQAKSSQVVDKVDSKDRQRKEDEEEQEHLDQEVKIIEVKQRRLRSQKKSIEKAKAPRSTSETSEDHKSEVPTKKGVKKSATRNQKDQEDEVQVVEIVQPQSSLTPKTSQKQQKAIRGKSKGPVESSGASAKKQQTMINDEKVDQPHQVQDMATSPIQKKKSGRPPKSASKDNSIIQDPATSAKKPITGIKAERPSLKVKQITPQDSSPQTTTQVKIEQQQISSPTKEDQPMMMENLVVQVKFEEPQLNQEKPAQAVESKPSAKKSQSKVLSQSSKKINGKSQVSPDGADMQIDQAMNADTVERGANKEFNKPSSPQDQQIASPVIQQQVAMAPTEFDVKQPVQDSTNALIQVALPAMKQEDLRDQAPQNSLSNHAEMKQSKTITLKGRKSEMIPKDEPQVAFVVPLTEEEIKLKYQDNEEYQEWSRRVIRCKADLNKGLKKGLPKIFNSDDEMDTLVNDQARQAKLRDIINDKYQDFKLQNIEPSGDDDQTTADFESFLEEEEVKRAFFKLICFKVEASSLNLRDLRKLCYQSILTDHFPEFSSILTDQHVETLLTQFALRKCYGTKPKNCQLYSDSSPLALWCWEVQEISMLDPVSEAQMKKARLQRSVVGKKLIALNQVVEMCSDYTTFDSPEKISKLATEFESYNVLLGKESSSDWFIRKRKHNEVEAASVSGGQAPSSNLGSKTASNVIGAHQQKPGAAKGGKRIKPNNEEDSEVGPQQQQQQISSVNEISEYPVNERSEAPPQSSLLIRKSQAVSQAPHGGNQQPPQPQNYLVTKYFKKTETSEVQGNFMIKSRQELLKNPHIQYFIKNMETEAMKFQQECAAIVSNEEALSSILDHVKMFKLQEIKKIMANSSNLVLKRRRKHIHMDQSRMIYQGIHFDKQSRIINCRTPFEKDPTVIDYEQDSDEEWEELYGENLEDDEMLEEENMEVFEDEAEKLNMPNAGISSDMKQKLAFRSQYCYQSLQFKEDDPELKKEGFIVADDYFSQTSSIEDNTENNDYVERSRKDLLIKQIERTANRMRRQQEMNPYILLDQHVDLGDYKAVCLVKKKTKQTPAAATHRVSFGGASGLSTADESDFPLSVAKIKKVEPVKLEIKDVIESLVELAHGSVFNKKQLTETFRKAFPDLKKSHTENFIKECFEKQKRPLDSKLRLYARADVVDKYGASSEFLQSMPLILEKKMEEERILSALQAQQQADAMVIPGGAGSHGNFAEDMAPPLPQQPTARKSAHQQSSRKSRMPGGTSSRQSARASSMVSINEDQVVHSAVAGNNRISQSQPDHSQQHPVPPASNNASLTGLAPQSTQQEVELDNQTVLESKLSLGSQYRGQEESEQPAFVVAPTEMVMTSSIREHEEHKATEDVEMMEAVPDSHPEQQMQQDEGSWVNVQSGAAIETPAFNSKLYSLGGGREGATGALDHFQVDEEDEVMNRLNHSQSQSFQMTSQLLEENQISLSQHAVVQYTENEEQKQVEIADGSFNRSNQQYQSTPIHNFRTLRSREISVNNSQNTNMAMAVVNGEVFERQRTDSMETDKGNPMMSHQDGGVGNSFESPRTHHSNLVAHYVDNTFLLTENDQQRGTQDQEGMRMQEQDVEETKVVMESRASNRRTPRRHQAFTSSMTGVGGEGERVGARKSKRLESRHRALQMQQQSYHNYQDDDELNHAQSQTDVRDGGRRSSMRRQ